LFSSSSFSLFALFSVVFSLFVCFFFFRLRCWRMLFLRCLGFIFFFLWA